MILLSEAARRTGKTKQAIRKAVAEGRVRGERDAQGRWTVDPASLFAMYQPVGGVSTNPTNQIGPAVAAELEAMRKLVANLESERDHLRHQLEAEATARQHEAAERRQLLALLTAPRPQPWWKRLVGA